MSSSLEDLAKRFRAEALKNYTPRITTQRFGDAVNTLNFITGVYTPRGNFGEATVPIRLMQNLCSLGRDGFEAASGYKYEHEEAALATLLGKVWYNFTAAILKWVQQQLETEPNPKELWYSCYQVPTWFIQAAKERAEWFNQFE